jgi:hypothetical protein
MPTFFHVTDFLKSEYVILSYMSLCFETLYIYLWLLSAYLMFYKAENCVVFYRHCMEDIGACISKPRPSNFLCNSAYGHNQ